jgi:hypothetical protein
METVAIQQVTFYEDQVRSWKDPDGRVFVVLRDPCLALGLDPQWQSEHVKADPLFQGHLGCGQITTSFGTTATRIFSMAGLDLEMIPMWLARINANMVNEAARPKLLRYQRECARVLREHWKNRATVEDYLLPKYRPHVPEYNLAFMQVVCRLYRQPLPESPYPCPCVVIDFIHKYIRCVLPLPVQEELRAVNPRNARGNRTRKDHQHFTEETLSKVERDRIRICLAIAAVSDDMHDFKRLLAKHDERNKVVSTDTQRYGVGISLQASFPFMLPAALEALYA